jgi:hypothetical protein
LLGSTNIDDLTFARRLGDGLTGLPQSLDVESDRLTDQSQSFFARLARRDAPREIWHVRSPPVLAPLDNNQILHANVTRDRLVQDTPQSPRRNLNAWPLSGGSSASAAEACRTANLQRKDTADYGR